MINYTLKSLMVKLKSQLKDFLDEESKLNRNSAKAYIEEYNSMGKDVIYIDLVELLSADIDDRFIAGVSKLVAAFVEDTISIMHEIANLPGDILYPDGWDDMFEDGIMTITSIIRTLGSSATVDSIDWNTVAVTGCDGQRTKVLIPQKITTLFNSYESLLYIVSTSIYTAETVCKSRNVTTFFMRVVEYFINSMNFIA